METLAVLFANQNDLTILFLLLFLAAPFSPLWMKREGDSGKGFYRGFLEGLFGEEGGGIVAVVVFVLVVASVIVAICKTLFG